MVGFVVTGYRAMTSHGLANYYEDGTTNHTAIKRADVNNDIWLSAQNARSPHALRVLTDGKYLTAEFAQLQDQLAGDLDTQSGNVRLRFEGLWLYNAASVRDSTSPVALNIGTRYQWEEGIIRLDPQFQAPVAITVGRGAIPSHQLQIVETSGVFHFRSKYYTGSGYLNYDWPLLAASVRELPVSTAQIPALIYFRILRTLDAAGNGSMNLYVHHQNGSGSQGVSLSTSYAPPAEEAQLGDTSMTGNKFWRILWYRNASSDTDDTGSSGGTTWSAPVGYEVKIATPSGDDAITWMDAGVADVYWNIPHALELYEVGGAYIEGRFYAANSIPAGDLTSLFTGDWTRFRPGEAIQLEAPGLQGRYFLTQLRFTPSDESVNPMIPFTAYLRANSNDDVIAAAFSANEWPELDPDDPEPIVVELDAEITSEATLPINPQYEISTTIRYPTVRMESELPYVTTYGRGSECRREWRFSWKLTASERDTLDAFFLARRGGEGAFTFTLPGSEGTAVGIYVGGSYEETYLAPNVYEVEAQIVEIGIAS